MEAYSAENTEQKHPLPAIALLIHDDVGNILAKTYMRPDDTRLHWALPEDFIHATEDYYAAAVRLTVDSTGVATEPSGVYAVISKKSIKNQASLSIVKHRFARAHRQNSNTRYPAELPGIAST